MTKREQLQEQYEDALFALLMDEFAKSEGRSAIEENERLKKDPDFVVPPNVERQCMRVISRYCVQKSIYTAGKAFSRTISKVAIVALIGMLLFTTAFAVSSEFRATTLNLVIQIFDDRTAFQLEQNSETMNKKNFQYQITTNWLPEGYILQQEEEDSRRTEHIYESLNGAELSIMVLKMTSGPFNVDTEEADVHDIEIANNSATFCQKGELTQLVWADEEKGVFINIRSDELREEDMIRIAENLLIEEVL